MYIYHLMSFVTAAFAMIVSKALVTTRRTCKCVLSACKNAGKTQDTYVVSTDFVRIFEHAERTQHFYGMRNFRCVRAADSLYVQRTYNLRKKCVCHFLPTFSEKRSGHDLRRKRKEPRTPWWVVTKAYVR